MKKLMIAAAAVALAGVASAMNVFDYKASVKYVDFKQVSVAGGKHWVKTVKSTSLKGYLVTSSNCACDYCGSATTPGFLVLTSSLAKKYDKDFQVKLMPANLLADMWSQKYPDEASLAGIRSATFEAQGYLFAGLGKSAFPDPDASPVYVFGDVETQATKYLFGQANIEDQEGQWVEPFLDAAGFGKAGWSSTADPICGKGTKGFCLKSLSGSVIGGSFSCLANWGVEAWRCQGWNNEDCTAGEYAGYDKLYNVISGTWSIKENTKLEKNLSNPTVAQLVTVCGQKLQSTFSLLTFDRDGVLGGEFVDKWFK